MKTPPKKFNDRDTVTNFSGKIQALSHQILQYSNRTGPRIKFIRKVLTLLMNVFGCDAVEMYIKGSYNHSHYEVTRRQGKAFRYKITHKSHKEKDKSFFGAPKDSGLARLYNDLAQGRVDPSLEYFTPNGGFYTGNIEKCPLFQPEVEKRTPDQSPPMVEDNKSLAIIPVFFENKIIGLLQFKSKKKNYFSKDNINFYEGIATTLGFALGHNKERHALLERVKELTCLYGIAQLAERPGISQEELLQKGVKLLPSAWQYPEIAYGRIVLDKRTYSTKHFTDHQHSPHKQVADIIVSGEKKGFIEVGYVKKRHDLDEGPFLKEERRLIDTIAKQIGLILERRQAEKDKLRLQDQLRHADRLATIGQLAAGVAHELNEPLSNILGFAQLAVKTPELSEQTKQDIEKIVSVSLYARDIINKLLIFARQVPSKKIQVDLNRIVEQGLYFFKSRCFKQGIDLVISLSPQPLNIVADAAQLNQVLVNLVVNALHAMPDGGRLTVKTLASQSHVTLIVEDTGIGMSKKVADQIFIPFFTTKDIDQGTGLGLPVVHGIVTSHKGYIKVESKVGVGTRFEIHFPLTISKKTD